jgi:tRNA splicing endonuclease
MAEPLVLSVYADLLGRHVHVRGETAVRTVYESGFYGRAHDTRSVHRSSQSMAEHPCAPPVLRLLPEEALFLAARARALHGYDFFVREAVGTTTANEASVINLPSTSEKGEQSPTANTPLSPDELLRRLVSAEAGEPSVRPGKTMSAATRSLLARYAVYNTFRDSGWVPREGSTSGALYALYGGDPARYHAAYTVAVLMDESDDFNANGGPRAKTRPLQPAQNDGTWAYLQRCSRVAETLKKQCIVCHVRRPKGSRPAVGAEEEGATDPTGTGTDCGARLADANDLTIDMVAMSRWSHGARPSSTWLGL